MHRKAWCPPLLGRPLLINIHSPPVQEVMEKLSPSLEQDDALGILNAIIKGERARRVGRKRRPEGILL